MKLTIQTTIKDAKRRLLRLAGQLGIGAREVLGDAIGEVKERMSVPGDPVRHPIDWDSPKQQRFVIAKLREEGNLPYARTNQYIRGFKTEAVPNGFALSNQHPAGAIGGLGSGWQSQIHRGRWPYLPTVVFEVLADLPAKVIDRLKVVVK